MSPKFVYGTTMLQIHINPKRERWNFRVTVGNVNATWVWYYNPENGIKIKKVKGGILELVL